jgi:hypothetical protein
MHEYQSPTVAASESKPRASTSLLASLLLFHAPLQCDDSRYFGARPIPQKKPLPKKGLGKNAAQALKRDSTVNHSPLLTL